MSAAGRTAWKLKWTGTVLSLGIIVAWAASIPFTFFCVRRGTLSGKVAVNYDLMLHLADGGVAGFWSTIPVRYGTLPEDHGIGRYRPQQFTLTWKPLIKYDGAANMSVLRLFVPLWIPFLLVVLFTAFFWRRDRRVPPGSCEKCCYNLTGNISGVCPECGWDCGRVVNTSFFGSVLSCPASSHMTKSSNCPQRTSSSSGILPEKSEQA